MPLSLPRLANSVFRIKPWGKATYAAKKNEFARQGAAALEIPANTKTRKTKLRKAQNLICPEGFRGFGFRAFVLEMESASCWRTLWSDHGRNRYPWEGGKEKREQNLNFKGSRGPQFATFSRWCSSAVPVTANLRTREKA